jgi:DNA-binding CsgD family transcriptional regulator
MARRARWWRAERLTITQIAKRFAVSPSTVEALLREPAP